MDDDLDIAINTEKLISLIKDQPVIYDKTLPAPDHKEKQYLWFSICKELVGDWEERPQLEKNQIGIKVYSRWKNLRTCFRREYNLQKEEERAHGDPPTQKKRKKYEFYDQLLFLLPSVSLKRSSSKSTERPKQRKMTSRAASPVVFEDSSNTFSPPSSTGEQIKAIPSVQIPGNNLPTIQNSIVGAGQAAQPMAAVQATQPMAAGQQAQPMAPRQAHQPLSPGQRAQPMAPGQRAQPMAPGQGVHPMAPGQPAHPMAPGQGDHPMAPGQPAHPMAPGQGDHPMAPGQGVHPMAPGQVPHPMEPGQGAHPISRLIDEDRFFVLSLVPALQRMSRSQKLKAKMKFLQAISDVEAETRETLQRFICFTRPPAPVAPDEDFNLPEPFSDGVPVRPFVLQPDHSYYLIRDHSRDANKRARMMPETRGTAPHERVDTDNIQYTAEDAKSHESVEIGNSQETAEIGNVQKPDGVSNSQETMEVGNSEDVEVGNVQETVEVGPSQVNVEISNVQETVEVGNSEKNIEFGKIKENIAVTKEKNVEISNIQETVEISDVQENVAMSNVQETVEVNNTQENVELDIAQEYVEPTDIAIAKDELMEH